MNARGSLLLIHCRTQRVVGDMRGRGHVAGADNQVGVSHFDLDIHLFQLVDQVGEGAQDAMGDRPPDDDGHPTTVRCAGERMGGVPRYADVGALRAPFQLLHAQDVDLLGGEESSDVC